MFFIDAFNANGEAVKVEVTGDREIYLDGERFTGVYIDLPLDLARDFDRVCDDLYDLPIFDGQSITARSGRFEARATAKLHELPVMERVGAWWSNQDIELVKIDGTVYALDGWNGEKFCDCWVCAGQYNDEVDEDAGSFVLSPIYKQVDEDESEIIGYDVSR